MFKSVFSKYLTAFIVIILLSFVMLSGIITSMIESYATDESEKALVATGDVVSSVIVSREVENLDTFVSSRAFSDMLKPLINKDRELEIVIADEDWRVLVSTLGTSENELREPLVSDGSVTIEKSAFSTKTNSENKEYLFHRGNLSGLLDFSASVCAKEIIVGGAIRGYVITFETPGIERSMGDIKNRAVITGTAWVMLAAVIAAYFITERIVNPIRNMTVATKQFAKGDFSSRVEVVGSDEVAALGNAFNNMADSLEKLENMRSTFLANVSHDLRTPMTTISGFIEGITSGAIPPEKHEHYLGVISAEVHRLSRLVSQLLDISRIESGDRKFNFANFDIAELARIILISFEQKIDDKKLDVEFISDCDQMYVYADRDAIHQVVYNLCHNAIKFSKDGGKFIIKITKTDNKKVLFSVFDEGETVSAEDANMIFERFYKTDKSRGLDKSGVGLGLYISKTIIDAHEEEINVKTVDDSGIEFWFTLKPGEDPKRAKTSDGGEKNG